jgi:Plasmid pRiA4b ORF-3-like protein
VTLPVIRRVEAPVTVRLDDLHFVLQIAIGWQNCHPFEFRVGETAWGCSIAMIRNRAPAPPRRRRWPTCWRSQKRSGTTMCLYGEDWGHTVELDAIEVSAPGVNYPRLVNAPGRCPPADIGGPTGYDRGPPTSSPRGHDRMG